jgi:hypothetical protein
MTFDELKPGYDRDGFAVALGFLPPADLAVLNRYFDL